MLNRFASTGKFSIKGVLKGMPKQLVYMLWDDEKGQLHLTRSDGVLDDVTGNGKVQSQQEAESRVKGKLCKKCKTAEGGPDEDCPNCPKLHVSLLTIIELML